MNSSCAGSAGDWNWRSRAWAPGAVDHKCSHQLDAKHRRNTSELVVTLGSRTLGHWSASNWRPRTAARWKCCSHGRGFAGASPRRRPCRPRRGCSAASAVSATTGAKNVVHNIWIGTSPRLPTRHLLQRCSWSTTTSNTSGGRRGNGRSTSSSLQSGNVAPFRGRPSGCAKGP